MTICRKCYVHPEIVTGYLTGALTDALAPDAIEAHKPMKGLTPEESAVLRLLEKRSKPTGQFAFAAKSLARSDPSRSQSRVRRPRK